MAIYQYPILFGLPPPFLHIPLSCALLFFFEPTYDTLPSIHPTQQFSPPSKPASHLPTFPPTNLPTYHIFLPSNTT